MHDQEQLQATLQSLITRPMERRPAGSIPTTTRSTRCGRCRRRPSPTEYPWVMIRGRSPRMRPAVSSEQASLDPHVVDVDRRRHRDLVGRQGIRGLQRDEPSG